MSVLKIKNGSTWEEIPAGGVGVPSGGNAGDVLVKSSSTDYATQWSSPSNAGCIQMELLWTNPNPSSAFAAQTISLDLSGYDAVRIRFNSKSAATMGGAIAFESSEVFDIFVGDTATCDITKYGGGSATSVVPVFVQRRTDVSSTGIVFYDALHRDGGSNGSVPIDDGYLRPTKIYGIKGVQ